MKKFKIALCRFPGSGWEHHGLTTWLMKTFHEMKQDSQIEGILSQVYSDTPITMTRNRAVKDALAEGCDYIMMVDSDMIPDYLVGRDSSARPFWNIAWGFMMNRRVEEQEWESQIRQEHGLYADNGRLDQEEYEKTVVEHRLAAFPPVTIAAPYCGPPPDECVYIFKWEDFETESPDWNYRLKMFERSEAYRFGGLGEVAAMGTGLILYDARVFKTLPPPWFDYEWEDAERTGKASTEDVYQTRNASMLKLPQFCAWDSWAIHVKAKFVKKPGLITSDMVHSSLAEAVRRGHNRNEQVRFIGEMTEQERVRNKLDSMIKDGSIAAVAPTEPYEPFPNIADPRAAMVEAANAYAVKVGQQAREAHLAEFQGDR